jgi:hypothetical protein
MQVLQNVLLKEMKSFRRIFLLLILTIERATGSLR